MPAANSIYLQFLKTTSLIFKTAGNRLDSKYTCYFLINRKILIKAENMILVLFLRRSWTVCVEIIISIVFFSALSTQLWI